MENQIRAQLVTELHARHIDLLEKQIVQLEEELEEQRTRFEEEIQAVRKRLTESNFALRGLYTVLGKKLVVTELPTYSAPKPVIANIQVAPKPAEQPVKKVTRSGQGYQSRILSFKAATYLLLRKVAKLTPADAQELSQLDTMACRTVESRVNKLPDYASLVEGYEDLQNRGYRLEKRSDLQRITIKDLVSPELRAKLLAMVS
jgi:hypothetical protein